jgi:hypothetical protein
MTIELIVPFNATLKDKVHYCLHCSCYFTSDSEIKRRMCRKGKWQFWKSCPSLVHFHHTCIHCGAPWIEYSAHTSKIGALSILRHLLHIMKGNDQCGPIKETMHEEITRALIAEVHES